MAQQTGSAGCHWMVETLKQRTVEERLVLQPQVCWQVVEALGEVAVVLMKHLQIPLHTDKCVLKGQDFKGHIQR